MWKVPIYEKWKKKWFETHPYEIAEYSWNYLFTGGKEIRSTLFCELWNYLSPDSEIITELAFAIECIHVASLVLDDTPWMDNATERRGRSTLHITFSSKKAILIVNDIISMAIKIWIDNKPSHINVDTWKHFLVSKLQRLAMGQFMDLGKSGNLVELASLKTGVLFELVAETVALCNNLDTRFWRIWGNNLGILFQWVDDWIDREEDIIQNNRNAFNEDCNTLHSYIEIWQKIETYIGSQWFQRPFGIFMKKYFIDQLNIPNSANVLILNDLFRDINNNLWTLDDNKCNDYICNIIVSELKNNKNPKFDKYIRKIIENIDKIIDLTKLIFEVSPTILWQIEEEKWENRCEHILKEYPIKNYKLQKYISYAKKYVTQHMPSLLKVSNISNVRDLSPIVNEVYDELEVIEDVDEWENDIEDNWEKYIKYIILYLKEHLFLPSF